MPVYKPDTIRMVNIHRREPPQNPNKSAKKMFFFSWEFLHG